ncbi:MAG: hypothetical protein WBP65_20715 [Candidatus Sulfotelmatobacter sp.]|jgi:hypothetical protein
MKRRWTIALLFCALLLSAILASANHEPSAEEREANEIRIGLAIAPVHLDLKGKDFRQVGLGSYIVNAQAVCAECHSCPTYSTGRNPYLGQPKKWDPADYLAGGVPFGPFVSRNITPDSTGKPAGLTRAQFKHVMRTGEDPENPGELLQVMPWPYFQDMTHHNLDAIYEYLSAIPSQVTPPAGSCSGAGQ